MMDRLYDDGGQLAREEARGVNPYATPATNTPSAKTAEELRETQLWDVLDWSLWGNGLGDVLRERMADVMVAALPDADRQQAESCIKSWHERRGPSMAVGIGTELEKQRDLAVAQAAIWQKRAEDRAEERDRLDGEVLRLQEQAGQMAEELERLRSVSLLRLAAIESQKHGNDLRFDRFEMAARDHEVGRCGAENGCSGERDARKALAEYGVEVSGER